LSYGRFKNLRNVPIHQDTNKLAKISSRTYKMFVRISSAILRQQNSPV
jgi:hypothetical protein